MGISSVLDDDEDPPESELEDGGKSGIDDDDDDDCAEVVEGGLLLEVSYIMPIESSVSVPYTSLNDCRFRLEL